MSNSGNDNHNDNNTPCYHCGLPVLALDKFTITVNQQTEQTCCPGCQFIAETIIDGGLDNYYQHRKNVAQQADNTVLAASYTVYDDLTQHQEFVFPASSTRHVDPKNDIQIYTAELLIGGVTCSACVWLIENQLQKLEGVIEAQLNYTQHRLTVTWNNSTCKLSDIFKTIANIGYTPKPFLALQQQKHIDKENKTALKRIGVAGIGMMQIGMTAVALHAGFLQGISPTYQSLLRWLSLAFCIPVVLYAAKPFFIAAWRSIKTKHASMDLSVSIAITLAFISSAWATVTNTGDVYFDSVAMFTFFLLLGRYLEQRIRHKHLLSHQSLHELLPETVHLLENDQLHDIHIKQLKPTQHIVVKAGEIIPADGLIIAGNTHINAAAFSGEAESIKKTTGDQVSAGMINLHQPITLDVQATANNSQLGNIITLAENALNKKPTFVQLTDKISALFVSSVLIIALLTGLYWYSQDNPNAFWIMLSVLVVSCPCALSLSIPTAITAATLKLRDKGILILQPHVLHTLPNTSLVAFDKTGTLTQGNIQCTQIINHTLNTASTFSDDELKSIAKSIEQYSEHPLASAFTQNNFASVNTLPVVQHQHVVGQGLESVIIINQTPTTFRIGSFEFVCALLANTSSLSDDMLAKSTQQQVVYLANHQHILASFILEDTIKPSAFSLLQQLSKKHIRTAMLTGDKSHTAKTIGNALSIDTIYSELTPEQKLQQLREWQQHNIVLALGDGINDSPLLAGADISMAVANASDLAKINADCLMLNPQLDGVNTTITTAKQTHHITRQNIAWAIGYNVVAIPLAALGYVPPYLAALGMSVSSLIVVLNASRLRR